MRLLSPQDYAKYHHLSTEQHQFAGNAEWMYINLAPSTPVDEQQPDVAMAIIDPASRLPFLHVEPAHHDVRHGKETKCHCHVSSIYDIKNINLTSAQRNLKLDHDRLGHISMQAVQRLYQPAEPAMLDFDGFTTSSESCLIAKEPAQLRCDLPCCEACQCAKA